ncbi:MAG: hypothetical protein HQK59_12975 [Deltaproteobacteria bacterium]|nr:hypothetical protein [Deltaproteobacteria bacterium]
MKILHIFKTEPDEVTKTLMSHISSQGENIEFKLYEPQPDYDRLVDIIFESDKVYSWW